MNDKWLNFLVNNGGSLQDGSLLGFGDPESEIRATAGSDIISALTNMAVIRVSGEEAGVFLQNQFTNDVNALNDGDSQLNAYCTPKGRMLVSFRIARLGNDYFIYLPAELLDSTLKRLQMFILITRATLEDVSNEHCCIGIHGPNSTRMLSKYTASVPAAINQVSRSGGLSIIRLAGQQHRYLISGPVEECQALWLSMLKTHTPCGPNSCSYLDIQAGIATIYTQTSEAFVPQMVNLQAVGGLSFTKGCYPGQEIVARMQYLGKLKRRMYLAHAECDIPPTPGDNLYAGTSGGNQAAGKIVDAQSAPQGGCDMLMVLQISVADSGIPVHLNNPQGPTLIINELPYKVEVADN
ncbi:MAG: folate-binding protein YgfZ [Gammaproteobacteria bacterium]|nr:MAG: folate-binding protein YgfZ [Gammaproteobacteria bacterium]